MLTGSSFHGDSWYLDSVLTLSGQALEPEGVNSGSHLANSAFKITGHKILRNEFLPLGKGKGRLRAELLVLLHAVLRSFHLHCLPRTGGPVSAPPPALALHWLLALQSVCCSVPRRVPRVPEPLQPVPAASDVLVSSAHARDTTAGHLCEFFPLPPT